MPAPRRTKDTEVVAVARRRHRTPKIRPTAVTPNGGFAPPTGFPAPTGGAKLPPPSGPRQLAPPSGPRHLAPPNARVGRFLRQAFPPPKPKG